VSLRAVLFGLPQASAAVQRPSISASCCHSNPLLSPLPFSLLHARYLFAYSRSTLYVTSDLKRSNRTRLVRAYVWTYVQLTPDPRRRYDRTSRSRIASYNLSTWRPSVASVYASHSSLSSIPTIPTRLAWSIEGWKE